MAFCPLTSQMLLQVCQGYLMLALSLTGICTKQMSQHLHIKPADTFHCWTSLLSTWGAAGQLLDATYPSARSASCRSLRLLIP